MSKLTNPDTEVSVSCGFFNGPNRKYDAESMSSIFDGIICDGIFATTNDDAFKVTESEADNTVNVGTGKCWFKHTWTKNDALLPVTCGGPPEVSGLSRIDAIVIEVNLTEPVKDNFIKCIPGTESSSPVPPAMSRADGVYQYPLCYITRAYDVAKITQADIEDVRVDTGFVTGPLEVLKASELTEQWFGEGGELDQFVEFIKADYAHYREVEDHVWNAFVTDQKLEMLSVVTELDNWKNSTKEEFLAWFETIRGVLADDPATNLQAQIDESEIERLLMCGFANATKTFSDDNLVITSTEPEDKGGRKLIKTFSSDFSTCTTVLYTSTDVELGRLVKAFSSDGSTISSELTISLL